MALVHPGQAPATVRRAVVRAGPAVVRALLELVLVAVLFELYRLGRLLARGQETAAFENAVDVHHLERLLHLPSEAVIQSWFPSDVLHLANIYYVSVHFPAMVAFLVWGYAFRPRAEYRWARNLVITLTATALVVHIVFPLAPPRMFPQWGFVDTMTTIGPSAYDGAGAALANQYAAMPSLHIGWALTLAVVVHRTGPLALRVLTKLHATATVFVVVITANHWWMDGIVVAALLVLAVAVVPHRQLRRAT